MLKEVVEIVQWCTTTTRTATTRATLVSLFLPVLNHNHRNNSYNVYTCEDFTNGVHTLETDLLRSQSSSKVRFLCETLIDSDHLFVHLFTISFAESPPTERN
jgi:hypothetical protein